MELDIIYNEDCLGGMKRLSSNTMGFIFYDPPYNVSKDYGIFNDNMDEEDYLYWQEAIICESQRISHNGFALLIPQKRLRQFLNIIPGARIIIVNKASGRIKWKSILMQWSALLTTGKSIEYPGENTISDIWSGIRLPGEGYFYREPRYPNPGQTSLALTKKIIRSFSREGETIVDPFMGCGTTAVACKQLNRHYIGFEINPEYCEIGKKRLSEVQLELIK